MNEQNGSDLVMVEDSPSTSSPRVGEQLAAARQARGLQVFDVAQALKLGARQVEALERGDWQSLPGQTFIRGFVRNYARLVQIDPAPLMTQLDAVLEKPVNTLAVPETRPASMPRGGSAATTRDRVVVLAGAGLVALAALLYFLVPNDLSALREDVHRLLDSLAHKEVPAATGQEAAPGEPVFPPGATPQQVMNPQAMAAPEAAAAPAPASDPAPAAGEAKAVTPAVPAAQTPPVADAPAMRFVFEKESWLEVRNRDNKLIFSQRVAAGGEQTLSGQGPFSLVIGYAPGVKVFWHGQVVDLAPYMHGDVARLVLE